MPQVVLEFPLIKAALVCDEDPLPISFFLDKAAEVYLIGVLDEPGLVPDYFLGVDPTVGGGPIADKIFAQLSLSFDE